MKKAVRTLLPLMLLLAVAPRIWAYELPTRPFSLRVQKMGVREVLEGLLADSGTGFDIDPQITNDTKISMDARQVKWSKLFTQILQDAGLTYGFDASGKILVLKK